MSNDPGAAPPPFAPVVPLRVRFDVASMGDVFRGMRALETFSKQRGFLRINVYVSDLMFRDPIGVFGIPNLAVHLQEHGDDYDYTLSGDSDVLVSR